MSAKKKKVARSLAGTKSTYYESDEHNVPTEFVHAIIEANAIDSPDTGASKDPRYIRIAVVSPIRTNTFKEFKKQLKRANTEDINASVVPGTVYIDSMDVKPLCGFTGLPTKKFSDGRLMLPAFRLKTDKRVTDIYTSFWMRKHKKKAYTKNVRWFFRLCDIWKYLNYAEGIQKKRILAQMENAMYILTIPHIALEIFLFLEILEHPQNDVGLRKHFKALFHDTYFDTKPSSDVETEGTMLESENSDNGDIRSSEEEEEEEEPINVNTSFETIPVGGECLDIPIRNRVIKYFVPLIDRRPASFVNELPKGLLLEFSCVPIDYRNMRTYYNFILSQHKLVSPGDNANLAEHERRLGKRVPPGGNLANGKDTPGYWSVWTPYVPKGRAGCLMQWDAIFAEIEYRMDPGVALLSVNRTMMSRKKFIPFHLRPTLKSRVEEDMTYIPKELYPFRKDKELEAKETLKEMHRLETTKKRRDSHMSRVPNQRMYVPCISSDDLARSGLLPSVYSALAIVCKIVTGYSSTKATKYLFPRLAHQEILKRRKAAFLFTSTDTPEKTSGRVRKKRSTAVEFNVPRSMKYGDEEYNTYTLKMQRIISYYEEAPEIERSAQRQRIKEAALRAARDSSRQTSEQSKENSGTREYSSEFFSSQNESETSYSSCEDDVYEDSESFSEGASRSTKRNSGLGTKRKYSPEVHRRDNEGCYNNKLFNVRRNFGVRRVDNFDTMTCLIVGVEPWVPQPFVSFSSLNYFYTTVRSEKIHKIKLEKESYMMIPIWLFPFVLMECSQDPLYKAIGNAGSIVHMCESVADSISTAVKDKTIPAEVAKEFDGLFHFFEGESIYIHRGAVTPEV